VIPRLQAAIARATTRPTTHTAVIRRSPGDTNVGRPDKCGDTGTDGEVLAGKSVNRHGGINIAEFIKPDRQAGHDSAPSDASDGDK